MEGDESIVPENTVMLILAIVAVAVIAVVVSTVLYKMRFG